MSSNVEEIIENLSTIQDVSDILRDPRTTTLLNEVVFKGQKGGGIGNNNIGNNNIGNNNIGNNNIGNNNINISNSVKYEQSGGFLNPMGLVPSVFDVIKMVVLGILSFLEKIFKELFYLPWRQKNRALFYKYVLFCIKCGFYLMIFAIAGPVFIIIGIVMVYSKVFAKMGTDGSTLIRERLSAVQQV